MKKFKKAVLFLTAAIMLTGCEDISQLPLDRSVYPSYIGETESNTEEMTEETVAYTEYVAEVPEMENTETELKI